MLRRTADSGPIAIVVAAQPEMPATGAPDTGPTIKGSPVWSDD